MIKNIDNIIKKIEKNIEYSKIQKTEKLTIKILNFIYEEIYNFNSQLLPKKTKYLFQSFLKASLHKEKEKYIDKEDTVFFVLFVFYPFFFNNLLRTNNNIIKKMYEIFIIFQVYIKTVIFFILLPVSIFYFYHYTSNYYENKFFKKQYYSFLIFIINEMFEFLCQNKKKIKRDKLDKYNIIIKMLIEEYEKKNIEIYNKELVNKIINKNKINMI